MITTDRKNVAYTKMYNLLIELNNLIIKNKMISLSKLMHKYKVSHEFVKAIKERDFIIKIDKSPLLLRQREALLRWKHYISCDEEQLKRYATILVQDCNEIAMEYVRKRQQKKLYPQNKISPALKPVNKSMLDNNFTPFTLKVLKTLGKFKLDQIFDFTYKDLHIYNACGIEFVENEEKEILNINLIDTQNKVLAVISAKLNPLYLIQKVILPEVIQSQDQKLHITFKDY